MASGRSWLTRRQMAATYAVLSVLVFLIGAERLEHQPKPKPSSIRFPGERAGPGRVAVWFSIPPVISMAQRWGVAISRTAATEVVAQFLNCHLDPPGPGHTRRSTHFPVYRTGHIPTALFWTERATFTVRLLAVVSPEAALRSNLLARV